MEDNFIISRSQARAFAAAIYGVTKEHLAQAGHDAGESGTQPDGDATDAVERRTTLCEF